MLRALDCPVLSALVPTVYMSYNQCFSFWNFSPPYLTKSLFHHISSRDRPADTQTYPLENQMRTYLEGKAPFSHADAPEQLLHPPVADKDVVDPLEEVVIPRNSYDELTEYVLKLEEHVKLQQESNVLLVSKLTKVKIYLVMSLGVSALFAFAKVFEVFMAILSVCWGIVAAPFSSSSGKGEL